MSITAIDEKTALILIDMQKGIVSQKTAHSVDDVLKHAGELAGAFRRHRLPVVLVNVLGGAPGRVQQRPAGERPADWAELMPQLDAQPGDHRVSKRSWGAFVNTDLAEYLRAQGVTQVVIGGVSTSIGVESTARQAYEGGFNVTLAVDAMTDSNADAHDNSVTRIFPRLGEIGTVREIVERLDARA
ncbi:isochorismatase family protein [Dyella sp. BiH032]|uniref:isochorismatase family protein n=1 Tax=Dyella sp. BiH032 TaxID=3075430 RepID=UPI002892E41D|nr:isochorismatase family protein [Dyella sp. BiH032]WNL44906.1 isochorismatase family protein [Dyella sp. BiH032]